MKEIDSEPFPRLPLIGAGLLVGSTILLAASVQLGILPAPRTAVSERAAARVATIETRDLRFTDRPDGALVITDVKRGINAETITHGTNAGFIRGVLRGLARDRMMRGIGQEPPFRLTLYADDALTLTDTATGRVIELGSFGPTNRQSFADLLLLHRPKPSLEALNGKVDL